MNDRHPGTRSAAALALASALIAGCGTALPEINEQDSTPPPPAAFEEFVDAPVVVEYRRSGVAFNLAGADAYSISLNGCVSGYTSTVTEADVNMKVYKYDQDCLAKLTTFTYGGIVFVPTVADPFATWLAGDSATFEESGNPANTLRVKVIAQLASPIGAADTVEYQFSEIQAGANTTIPKTTVGEPHTVTVAGLSAPAYTIAAYQYIGMTAAGAGEFRFTLECNSAVTGAGATLACEGTDLSLLKYVLVEDTFGGTLTIDQAAGLFGGTAVDPVADGLAAGAGGTVNGGFITADTPSALTGPAAMHTKPNMLLVIEADAMSYTYFNVDVELVTQP